MKNDKLKIAMVAPPFGPTGGPEVVVKNLTNALLDKGIDVTLFAPADWKTEAKHIHTLPQSIWNMKNFSRLNGKERVSLVKKSQELVLNYQKEFDIIHLHSQRRAFPVCSQAKTPCVVSFHSSIKIETYDELKSTGAYLVALSDSQRKKLAMDATIWNGVPMKNIKHTSKQGSYLIAIGRLTEQKGIDQAIKIARSANKKLLIFGRIGISSKRQAYFQEKIQPFLNEDVVLMDEVSNEEIFSYLRGAEALLFPIKKREVCPMVVMEALACGTPVIGSKVAPLPELLTDSRVAFLSKNIDDLIEAAKNIDGLFERQECRKYAENNFDSSVMAEKYIELYQKFLGRN